MVENKKFPKMPKTSLAENWDFWSSQNGILRLWGIPASPILTDTLLSINDEGNPSFDRLDDPLATCLNRDYMNHVKYSENPDLDLQT